jgi:hypothetical protein
MFQLDSLQMIALALTVYLVYYVYSAIQEGKARKEAEEKARREKLAQEISKEASEKFANACCDLVINSIFNIPKK